MQDPPDSWDAEEGEGGGNARGLLKGPAASNGAKNRGPSLPTYGEQTMRSLEVRTIHQWRLSTPLGTWRNKFAMALFHCQNPKSDQSASEP